MAENAGSSVAAVGKSANGSSIASEFDAFIIMMGFMVVEVVLVLVVVVVVEEEEDIWFQNTKRESYGGVRVVTRSTFIVHRRCR